MATYTLTMRFLKNATDAVIADSPHQSGDSYFKLSGNYIYRSTSKTGTYSYCTNTRTATSGSSGNSKTVYVNLWNVNTFNLTRPGYHIDGTKAYRVGSATSTIYVNQDTTSTSSTNAATAYRLNSNAYVSANKTVNLYVNWIGNSYSVKFNASGGSGSMSNQTGFVFGTGKALSANTFTRTGYTFAGWSKSSGGVTQVFYVSDVGPYDPVSIGTDGTYLYFKQNSTQYYRVTVDNSNSYTDIGSTAPSGVSTWIGEETHFTFQGNEYYWYHTYNDNSGIDRCYIYRVDNAQTVDYTDGASMSDAGGTIPVADGSTVVNLYAVWTPNTYTVVANTNGGKFNNYSYGQTDSNGWTYQSNTTIQKPIVFNTLYGSLPAETPVNTGYTFDGWYTYASGGYQITPQTVKDDTITNIYAHWEDTAPVITVLSTSVFSSNYYASVTFKIVDKSTIIGYYVGPSNSPTSYLSVNSTSLETSWSITSSPAYIVAKDTAEHIAYVFLPIYKLTANANGGTTSDSTGWAKIDYSTSVKFIPYNAAYTVLPSATRSGYTFDGWYDAPTGGNQITTSSIMTDGDMTIYAHWTWIPKIYIKQNGSWVDGSPRVNVNGTWKSPTSAYIKANGTWKQIY